MGVYKLFLIIMVLCFFSCNGKIEKGSLEIYHLKPDDIINREENGEGGYSKEREDFFTVKNYNFENESHKIKIDSFVINYISNDNFLMNKNNTSWGLVFFKYGGGITENTKHEYNTDYTIHQLFAPNKKICSYYFNTRIGYVSAFYKTRSKNGVIDKRKRKLVENYFKKNPLVE